jgi:tetratricopeptide (TPR) repeat protein
MPAKIAAPRRRSLPHPDIARRFSVRYFASGAKSMIRMFLAAFLLLVPTMAGAEWHEATSTHFIVYSEGSQAEARDFAARLERFNFILRSMRRVTADRPSIRLRVFLMPNHNAIERLTGPGVRGYYIPDARGLMLVGTRRRSAGSADIRTARFNLGEIDPEIVLFHEYAHHFMFQYFPATYPVWYSEGFAEFWGATRILPGDVVEVGLPADHRFATLRTAGWLSLERLLGAHDYSEVPGYMGQLYAQGWLLMRYVFDRPERQRQINDYLRLINEGMEFPEAARRAIPDMAAFNNELYTYAGTARFTYIRLPFRAIDVGAITARTLRPAEQALILDEIRLSQGYPEREAAAFAAEVRRDAAAFPDDPLAIRLVMETQYLAGAHAEAMAAAERLLAIEPNNARALATKGLIQAAALGAARSSDAAAWTAARRFLVRAVNAAPQDPIVLQAYYRSFLIQSVLPPESAQNALYTAMELAPSDDELRYQLARDFEQREMIREAIAIIRPVAYQTPHRGNESDSERRRREEREERNREAGQERHESPRQMLARLQARLPRS